jgi:hypothetical protein
MVIGILVILTIILLLIMLGAIWGINVAMDKMVGDKHRALEEIMTTGQAPAAWRNRYNGKIARLRANQARAAEAAVLEKRAVADYVRQLDRLVAYTQKTSLIEGEDTRQMLLKKLAEIRVSWQKQMA